jgi:small subunit ribosomal protein S2
MIETMPTSTTTHLPTLQELLEAGVHFGHRRERSHPKTRFFTFTIRDGIFIINLEETVNLLTKAIEYLRTVLDQKQTILFVGTKRQYQDLVKKAAHDLGMPYVTTKWLGGTLTNFEQIRKTAKKLADLENVIAIPTERREKQSLPRGIEGSEIATPLDKLGARDDRGNLTKKERLLIEREIGRLHERYDGIKELTSLPDILFVVDPHQEMTAVNEAKLLNIPIVAIFDTTTNPQLIDVPIPANDDSRKSVELILKTIVEGLTASKTDKPKKEETKKPKNLKTKKQRNTQSKQDRLKKRRERPRKRGRKYKND